MNDYTQKPPLGLRPRSIAKQQRLQEILLAMIRYTDENMKFPTEWVVELDELNMEKSW